MKENVNGRTEAFIEKVWPDKHYHYPQIFNKIFSIPSRKNLTEFPKDQFFK